MVLDSRTKRAFLSKARHNLKNPVNAILGYSEMLIEDCEDEGLASSVDDISKLNQAGREILSHIETCLSDNRLLDPNKTIMELGREIEIQIRTPLNTVVGLAELLQESDSELNNKIEHFRDDLGKIITSAKMLSDEIENVIHFKTSDAEEIRSNSLNTGHLSMIKDVIDSIEPINPDEIKDRSIGDILVVDDNPNNTELLKKRLKKQGHNVFVANNGREALVEIMTNADSLDLVLLDIVMPEMNGYEVLKFIKNDKRFYYLPVIMISSMDDPDSIYRCIDIGADDYIQKPFEQAILDARISNCIEKKQLRDKEKDLIIELEKEREKSDNLLFNILPKEIADRLKLGETNIANKHHDLTIIFADIVKFTPQAKDMNPEDIVSTLNNIFTEFDTLAQRFGLEKIKTIGDSYFAVSGLNGEKIKSAVDTVFFGIEILKSIKILNKSNDMMDLELRIGIHSGSAVSGVIGKKKFAFDIWGSTINFANRLETTSPEGKIHISEETKVLIEKENRFKIDPLKKIDIKGIGEVQTYTVSSI